MLIGTVDTLTSAFVSPESDFLRLHLRVTARGTEGETAREGRGKGKERKEMKGKWVWLWLDKLSSNSHYRETVEGWAWALRTLFFHQWYLTSSIPNWELPLSADITVSFPFLLFCVIPCSPGRSSNSFIPLSPSNCSLQQHHLSGLVAYHLTFKLLVIPQLLCNVFCTCSSSHTHAYKKKTSLTAGCLMQMCKRYLGQWSGWGSGGTVCALSGGGCRSGVGWGLEAGQLQKAERFHRGRGWKAEAGD